MYIKKIVTHSGNFHADELLAICMVKMFLKDGDKIPVERVSVVPEKYLKDKEVMVIDIGRSYDKELRNFDHHQDSNLPAACILVGREVCPEDIYPYLERYLLGYVSDVDTGKIWSDFPSVNNILRKYETFDDAILVATIILRGFVISAYKAKESIRVWSSLEKLNGIVINRTNTPVMNWKSMAEREGIYIMITPSDREEGWNVILRSTEYVVPLCMREKIGRDKTIIKIIPDDKQIFLHNEGFMAVYREYNDALSTAQKVVETINEMFNIKTSKNEKESNKIV